MRPLACLVFAALLGSTIACDNPAANMTTRPSPTGDAMFPIPGNVGYVSVTAEATQAVRGAKGKKHSATIVACFYQPDGSTPMEPAPTDVSVKLGVDDGAQPIALSPSPGESKIPSRFASPQGEYPEGPQGKISAKIKGQTAELTFSSR